MLINSYEILKYLKIYPWPHALEDLPQEVGGAGNLYL